MSIPTQGYQWTLVDAHPTRRRTFRRPLDAAELAFCWDGRFNGTADNVQHVTLRRLSNDDGAHRGSCSDLFSEANVVRAWLSTKRRYPLVGATLVSSARGGHDDDKSGWGRIDSTETLRSRSALASGLGSARETKPESDPRISTDSDSAASIRGQGWDFVVHEADLTDLRPGEIVFGEVANVEEAQQQAIALLADPRPLSDTLLVRLYVFRETGPTDPSGGFESDITTTAVLHVMALMAHCVTDGMANNTFFRCFVDTLARGAGGSELPAQVPLEERLAMAVPRVELEPAHIRALNPARRQWRLAVGLVIYQLRMAKRQGGHTLPCRLTPSTPYVAARSSYISTTLTPAQSAAVIANCRLHDVTFGNALSPLAQVAMTRVLFRRYLRGEISEAEWEHRKRQPYISGGALNIRPYLDRAWFERGGGGEFVLSISFFFCQLPFMTLGSAAGADRVCYGLSDSAPTFGELLTFDRFLHRAGLMKRQAEGYLKHPLSFEIARAVNRARLKITRHATLQWMKRLEGTQGNGMQESSNDEVLAVTDLPMVRAHGGSSLGDVDSIFPSEYPLPPSHSLSPSSSLVHPAKAGYTIPPVPPTSVSDANARPTIAIEYSGTRLHARPAELYLGAASSRGRLTLFVFYDGNVFEDGVVREWLDEVEGAVLWYLGRAYTKSRRPDSASDCAVGAGSAGDGGPAGLARGGINARL